MSRIEPLRLERRTAVRMGMIRVPNGCVCPIGCIPVRDEYGSRWAWPVDIELLRELSE
jgi:hypothetical protein